MEFLPNEELITVSRAFLIMVGLSFRICNIVSTLEEFVRVPLLDANIPAIFLNGSLALILVVTTLGATIGTVGGAPPPPLVVVAVGTPPPLVVVAVGGAPPPPLLLLDGFWFRYLIIAFFMFWFIVVKLNICSFLADKLRFLFVPKSNFIYSTFAWDVIPFMFSTSSIFVGTFLLRAPNNPVRIALALFDIFVITALLLLEFLFSFFFQIRFLSACMLMVSSFDNLFI